jgi:glycosyltransferase 2 family protein
LIRWLVLGGTFFFVLKAFKENWQNVVNVNIAWQGWFTLAIALLVTLFAHCWSGLVWAGLLKAFKQPVTTAWTLRLYLTTNIAKYLPGNVGHFYGRVSALHQVGVSLSVASLIVLLEPLLMAAAAFLIALLAIGIGVIKTKFLSLFLLFGFIVITIILIGIQPKIFNKLLHFFSKFKNKKKQAIAQIDRSLSIYLWGEIGFVLLRGIGFILTWMTLTTPRVTQIPTLLGVFSGAWLMGLLVPGAPGGIGVFEAVMLAAIPKQYAPQEIVLSAIALFRLISISAEAIAAGGAWWWEKSLKS